MRVGVGGVDNRGLANPMAPKSFVNFGHSFEYNFGHSFEYLETIDTHATASMKAAAKYTTTATMNQPPQG